MPNDFDGKPCKYGVQASGYCNKKPKKGRALKVCKYGKDSRGFCNDKPEDGRYGKPEPSTSPNGVPSNSPPAPTYTEVKQVAEKLKKDTNWVPTASVISIIVIGTMLGHVWESSERDRRAQLFVSREVNRVQKAISRAMSDGELATLTAQYIVFFKAKWKDAQMIDSKRPNDREKAWAARNFLDTLR